MNVPRTATTWGVIPSNHAFWTAEYVVLAAVVVLAVVFGVLTVLRRRSMRFRRAAGRAYFDKDMGQMGLGPAGFGNVGATSTTTSDPLAPTFGSPGSSLERTSTPTPAPPPAPFRGGTPDLATALSPTPDAGIGGGLPVFAPGGATAQGTSGDAQWAGQPPPPPPPAAPRLPAPAPGTPAAWLPDPGGDPSLIRYWDGFTWTEHVARHSS